MVLLLDQAGNLFSRRVSLDQFCATSIDQNRNVLMQELDRFEGMVVMTTNLIGNYDEALLRRVQHHIQSRLPDASMRREIFALHLPNPERVKAKSVLPRGTKPGSERRRHPEHLPQRHPRRQPRSRSGEVAGDGGDAALRDPACEGGEVSDKTALEVAKRDSVSILELAFGRGFWAVSISGVRHERPFTAGVKSSFVRLGGARILRKFHSLSPPMKITPVIADPDLNPRSLSIRDVAFRHGVSQSTVRRWIADGRVRVLRFSATCVRIPLTELEKLERDSLC